MKPILISGFAGLALVAGTALASAQTIIIEPEDEVIIRDYVITRSVAPYEPPTDFEVIVGERLPEPVELYAIEAPEYETEYRYVVIDDRTVIVEPETREIIRILD